MTGSAVISDRARVREAAASLSAERSEVFAVDRDRRLVGRIDDHTICRAVCDGVDLEDVIAVIAEPVPVVVDATVARADVLDLMRARALSAVPALDARGRVVRVHLADELLGGPELPNAAVIMAGGRGQRLAPLTDAVPKPMLPVAGRPILERLVLHLVGAGVRTVFLAVNYRAEQIERHFGDGAALGCAIRYLREDAPLGSGGALSLLAAEGVAPREPLLVLNGDLVSGFDVCGLLDEHAASDVAATIAVHEHRYEVPFGVIESNGRGLVRLVEKPVASWLVNAGIYVIEPALLARIPASEPYPITRLFEECLRRDEHVGLWRVHSDWQDIGRPLELARARGEL